MSTISAGITAHQRQALDAATSTIGVIARSWEKYLADLESANTDLRHQVQQQDARINRLIAHIALLEGVDINVARVRHMEPEEEGPPPSTGHLRQAVIDVRAAQAKEAR